MKVDPARSKLVRFVTHVSLVAGSPRAFVLALCVVGFWLVTGFFLHFSNSWQSLISTITSVVTFLMLFILQYSQNREIRAFQLKLDELIRATEGAKNSMVSLEKLSDQEVSLIGEQYHALAEASRKPFRGKREKS